MAAQEFGARGDRSFDGGGHCGHVDDVVARSSIW
jgi:hypothetical protein